MASRSCSAGFHDDCAAICICWCHKIERVSKVSTIKTYRVELHTLTETRAEFREVQEKAEKYASALRIFSVLISGTFLAALKVR